MKIDIKKLRDWFPQRRKDLDLREAWEVITTNYCAPLTREGVCPEECEKCKLRLANMLALSEARKPAALLTFKAREEAAFAKEEARTPTERPDVDVYDAVNPFDKILESL
jgi:hypothetical protein